MHKNAVFKLSKLELWSLLTTSIASPTRAFQRTHSWTAIYDDPERQTPPSDPQENLAPCPTANLCEIYASGGGLIVVPHLLVRVSV